MSSAVIPIGVRSFITKNIHSVTELEALLLIWRSGHHSWSSEVVARQLYVSVAKAAKTLEALRSRGLLIEYDGQYAFDRKGIHSAVVADLSAAYRKHLITVTNLVHANEKRALRSHI